MIFRRFIERLGIAVVGLGNRMSGDVDRQSFHVVSRKTALENWTTENSVHFVKFDVDRQQFHICRFERTKIAQMDRTFAADRGSQTFVQFGHNPLPASEIVPSLVLAEIGRRIRHKTGFALAARK